MSPKADKKTQRRLAAAQEAARRFRKVEASSPLSRSQLDALHDDLARQIISNGHDGTFSISEQWLTDNQLPVEKTLEFFRSQRLSDDFELAVNGDSYKLFGPIDGQKARMSIQRDELESLIEWLSRKLSAQRCDHSHRLTRTWLSENGYPLAETEMALLSQGGGCDCEVIYNVDPDNVFS